MSDAPTEERTKAFLDEVKATLGRVPNMMTTMAISPAVLKAHLDFSKGVAKGPLSLVLRTACNQPERFHYADRPDQR